VSVGRKACRVEFPLRSRAGRKFVLSVLPPALAGIVLTLALVCSGDVSLVPGTWLPVGRSPRVRGGGCPNMEYENERES
jgi:hypothetical protein